MTRSACLPHEPVIDDSFNAAFHATLPAWYRAHRRDLPWRRREDDPYAIWVAEVMLQQTQVASVIPYYERWMTRFPTVRELAAAPLEEVLLFWAGLGYYARARNLHRAAQIVIDRFAGHVPDGPGELDSLPGIGRYTRGAILSIGFGRRAPLVDANVARVLSRVLAISGDPRSSAARARIWQAAEELVPETGARTYNQALMELGALVCAPADPACDRCPLLGVCIAGQTPDPTAWPETSPGRAVVRVTHASAVIRDGERVLLVLRPPHGLWGGLWEFPRRVCEPGESPSDCAVRAAREVTGVEAEARGVLGSIKHAVTHHAVTLHAVRAEIRSGTPAPLDCAQARWVTVSDLGALPLSAPQERIAQILGSADARKPGVRTRSRS